MAETWDFFTALDETLKKQYADYLLISDSVARFAHLQKHHNLVCNPIIPGNNGRLIKIKGYYIFENDELTPVDPVELEKRVSNDGNKT